jgi:hypothetical protein
VAERGWTNGLSCSACRYENVVQKRCLYEGVNEQHILDFWRGEWGVRGGGLLCTNDDLLCYAVLCCAVLCCLQV